MNQGALDHFRSGFDFWLLLPLVGLCLLGLVMVSSASMDFASAKYANAFFHLQRHGVYLILGIIALLSAYFIPLKWIQTLSPLLLMFSISLLILVLFVGSEINGSKRWINLGVFTLQPSETTKVAMVFYLAGYLVRHQQEVRTRFSGFIKPMIVLSVVVVLLLLEPDFGSFVVILASVLGMMFLGGVKAGQFFLLITCSVAAAAAVLFGQEYRVRRLMSFLEPFSEENVYAGGYQLSQALIAFGRGEWFGVGLGKSIQKLFYLPEAHTDFVLSILAEELGFIGVVCVLALFSLLVARILYVGRYAEQQKQYFSAYVCYGVGIVFAIQAAINVGVNMGVLPTKGLTLPFVSFGGSSIIVCLGCMGVVFNIVRQLNSPLIAAATNEKEVSV